MDRSRLLALGALATALLTTAACSATQPARTVTVITPPAAASTSVATGNAASSGATASSTAGQASPTATPRDPDTTTDDVAQAELPNDHCHLPDGARLSNGKYDLGSGPNAVLNSRVKPIAADLDGSGVKRMFVAVSCTAGGVGWPDMLLEVGPGGKLLAHTNMYTVAKTAFPSVQWDRGTFSAMSLTDKGIATTFQAESGAMPVSTFRGWFTLNNGQLAYTRDDSDPFAGAVLTTDGYGPVTVGMTKQQLIDAGFGSPYAAGGSHGTMCPGARENDQLKNAGIFFVNSSKGVLQAIGTRSASVKTRSGAHVGMTVDELKAIYGSQLTQTQTGFQAPETVWEIVSGNHSLMFFPDSYGSNKIGTIYAVNQTGGYIDHGSDNC